MARTTNYGLGQYRFNKNYSYIDLMGTAVMRGTTVPDPNKAIYKEIYRNDHTGTTYQDVLITFPLIGDKKEGLIQYGETYYIELTLPQNQEFTTTIDLKLCAAVTTGMEPDLDRFQNIKRIIVPPTPTLDDKIYSQVLLFESPTTQNKKDEEIILAAVIEDYPGDNNPLLPYHLYKYGENYYYSENNGWGLNDNTKINNKSIHTLTQSWKVKEGEASTVTYKFAFSPKYNLEGGYKYLLIETSRENPWSQNIQWIGPDKDGNMGDTYYGTTLKVDQVDFKLYSVSNLLERDALGQAQIQSGTGQLTHIGIWGHPEQAFTINGEEIKIGQSGFYELNDFVINTLGVIVTNDQVDRFTIDYEYKIVN